MSDAAPQKTSGILHAADLGAAVADKVLDLGPGADGSDDRIQPASVDLSLGGQAWRVRAAFLPGTGRTVAERINGLALHQLDLSAGAVLEKGCVYLVPLRERVRLPSNVVARANPKSSTGRIDVFVRLVTDHGVQYDTVPGGYEGPLFAEISPRTFSLLVRTGTRLNQLRLRRGAARLSDEALKARHEKTPLVTGAPVQIDGGLRLSLDLSPEAVGAPVGWRARRHTGLVDADKVGALDPEAYFDPVHPTSGGELILDPGEFYILRSREELSIPADLAAEMVAIDTELGAFRAHYAGFFDPGFGVGQGSRAVLEVRGYDAPFVIEHGQTVARLTFEGLTGAPPKTYGAALGSHYQGQGLRLSKHFR